MNIILTPQNNFAFSAKQKTPKAPKIDYSIKEIPFQESEIVPNLGKQLPEKFEYSELELKAKQLMTDIRKLEREVLIRKRDLRDYYSPHDKAEYKDVLKLKRNKNSQFRMCAKKAGVEELDLWRLISRKIDYNFYAPKIFRAESLETLENIKARFLEYKTGRFVEKLLLTLVEYRRRFLK